MPEQNSNVAREKKTIEAMLRLYCKQLHHGAKENCAPCNELQAYALSRLDKCPYGEKKSTCQNCPTHCYKADMRQRIKEVMRYAGPRMLLKHPLLTFWHLVSK